MKTIRIIILPCILGLFLSFHTNAQVVDCSTNYEAALRLYNYGMADSALNILKPCLESKKALKQVPKETSANIFRLAALASIMTGNPQDADKYITQLLKYQPDYKDNIRDDDLEEFRLILNSKSAQPDIRLGVRAGMNIPFLNLEKKYSDFEAQERLYSLEGSSGYQFGITGEKTFTKNISMEVGVGLTQILFKYESNSQAAGKNQYDQSITYIEIPVLARYNFTPNSSIRPYIQGGVSGKFSLYQREKSDNYGSFWFTESSSSDYILATFLTDIENIGIVLGGGVGYNLKSFGIRADLRYIHHLSSSARSSNFDNISGYDNIPSDESFGYTNDINLINLKNFQISVGFVYNLKYKVF